MDQAEQLRSIIKANNIQKSLARVIAVTSGKGGVGKSSTSINLAIQLRKLGQRVIILDADFGLANIEIMFGIMPKNNLSDVIYQGKSISEIITWGPMEVGFISGGYGSRDFGCGSGVFDCQRGNTAGDHTGAYFNYGFLFSDESAWQSSGIFSANLSGEGDRQQGGEP